jgi:hypothetical protein
VNKIRTNTCYFKLLNNMISTLYDKYANLQLTLNIF